MLVPDDKDWTWVLERACPECGFDADATDRADVSRLIHHNVEHWQHLLADHAIHPGRPDPATWSPLEYACHVRDVYRRYDERLHLMLTEDDPLFPNWDQDATALDEEYDTQDPAAVIDELTAKARAVATRLDGLSPDEWPRPGRRSDGASFTVDTISRYMVHDTIHHIWDLTQA